MIGPHSDGLFRIEARRLCLWHTGYDTEWRFRRHRANIPKYSKSLYWFNDALARSVATFPQNAHLLGQCGSRVVWYWTLYMEYEVGSWKRLKTPNSVREMGLVVQFTASPLVGVDGNSQDSCITMARFWKWFRQELLFQAGTYLGWSSRQGGGQDLISQFGQPRVRLSCHHQEAARFRDCK